MSKETINPVEKKKKSSKRTFPSCLECSQLIVTSLVPVAIAVYTFVQHHNEQSIALANREKDLEIARDQRTQDLQLVDDQFKENILAAYEIFLVEHLNRYGMDFNDNELAKYIARFKTLNALSLLDRNRKTFLFHSLYEAKLIVNYLSSNGSFIPGLISLEHADLTNVSLDRRNRRYLAVARSNLTGATFSGAQVGCSSFVGAELRYTDFSDAIMSEPTIGCFSNNVESRWTDLKNVQMQNSRLLGANFIKVDLSFANLSYANLTSFSCMNCRISNTIFYRADLTSALLIADPISTSANFVETHFVSTKFRSSKFHSPIFLNVRGTKVSFTSSSVTAGNVQDSMLKETSISRSNLTNNSFRRINLSGSSFNEVTLVNVTIHDSDLTRVTFNHSILINVTFRGSLLLDVSFLHCKLTNTSLTVEQHEQLLSFSHSTFD